jgi:predicted O-linked N-acetylglucosamine transferase (SPINDLY family)
MDTIQRAIELCRNGKFADAEAVCRKELQQLRGTFDLYLLFGNILLQQNKAADAALSLERATQMNPVSVEAKSLLAGAYYALNRRADALSQFDRIAQLRPGDPQTEFNRGVLLAELGRLEEAIASYDRVLAKQPKLEDALFNRANALLMLGRGEEALAVYDRVLAGNAQHVGALVNRGNALSRMGRADEALACFERVLSIKPEDVNALNNVGNIFKAQGRLDDAMSRYDRAIAIAPNYVEAIYNRGVIWMQKGRLEAAKQDLERALALNSDYAVALDALIVCKTSLCDWNGLGELITRLMPAAAEGLVEPFTLLKTGVDSENLYRCMTNYARRHVPAFPRATIGRSDTSGRIRIAYVSADFRVHPIPYLITEVFELHDRSKFEVIGISLGPDDKSDVRARIIKAFDQFHDVQGFSDNDAAALIRTLDVDIAVDLNNYTEMSRPGILARRPAMVQASYLGVPVTMGADFIDYAIADKFVLPPDQHRWWVEKIVTMPDSYLAADMVTKRGMPAVAPTRAEAGLPEHGFVFCCFNNSFKITPPLFQIWMRLLAAVEGSVAWFSPANEGAWQNLEAAAKQLGIDPARLIFAPRVERVEDHLSRHRAADLFLDTLPYNAHTTAADALWAGLPVVTCAGVGFASRVAGSLLHTIGLPELVTLNLPDYEALALKLARDPALLGEFRTMISQNRDSSPLFDTVRFTRHLEQAYTTMVRRAHNGETPADFIVDPTI